MDELRFRLRDKELIIVSSALIIIFFLVLFKITGIRLLLGAFLVFFLPCYLILNNFNLKKDEKIIFSFFFGLVIYSTFVYWIGLSIGSIRIAMVVSFILLIGIAFLIKRYKSRIKAEKNK